MLYSINFLRGSRLIVSPLRVIKDALGLNHYTSAVPSEGTLERAFRFLPIDIRGSLMFAMHSSVESPW